MLDYFQFMERLRRTILPDVPMTSHAEWRFHRMAVDRLYLFLLIPLRMQMRRLTEGMSGEDVAQLYQKTLDFFKGRYAENGQVNPPSKISPPQDVALKWSTEGQIYLNHSALYFSHHFIRLVNGASVNFVVVPSRDGMPKTPPMLKGRKYVLFDEGYAMEGVGDGFIDAPCSSIEAWDDDLFVYFHFRKDETKTAQGKFNDATEREVLRFIDCESMKKFKGLREKAAGGKTLLRTELNRFTRRINSLDLLKFCHKDLRGHFMQELEEEIKRDLLAVFNAKL